MGKFVRKIDSYKNLRTMMLVTLFQHPPRKQKKITKTFKKDSTPHRPGVILRLSAGHAFLGRNSSKSLSDLLGCPHVSK